MEVQEDVMGSYSSSSNSTAGKDPRPLVVKRRRTQRHRSLPPASAAAASSSAEESGFTDEEEDMANCLILLAQGGASAGKFTSRRFAEAVTTAGGRAGYYVYECKTCNKCFPSFQALGGHRASHKKLKMAAEDNKGVVNEVSIDLQISLKSLSKRVDSVGKGKVHECLICGSEFSSGQALGGHMRRHRPAMELPEEVKKEKNVLYDLDLNLPAPAEDDNPFAIAGKPQVFSTATATATAVAAVLVNCHY